MRHPQFALGGEGVWYSVTDPRWLVQLRQDVAEVTRVKVTVAAPGLLQTERAGNEIFTKCSDGDRTKNLFIVAGFVVMEEVLGGTDAWVI